jgi:peptidyl-tRNA hydrolase
MTYVPDLAQTEIVVSVGYLSREYGYTRGEVSDLVFDRLVKLAQVEFRNPTSILGPMIATSVRADRNRLRRNSTGVAFGVLNLATKTSGCRA